MANFSPIYKATVKGGHRVGNKMLKAATKKGITKVIFSKVSGRSNYAERFLVILRDQA